MCAGKGNTELGIGTHTMKRIYKPPTLILYGPITDHTFQTPGGHIKGSVGTTHVDNFSEVTGHDSSLAIS